MFPTHLPPKMLSEMWKRMDEAKVYVDRRYFCSSPTSVFNPSAFVLFQCQVSVNVDIMSQSHLWRDGIIVARARKSHIQCLAVMVERLRSVDFVARGKEGSESECLSLLDDVMNEWTDVVEKHSPGTDYEMAYLSRKHLTEHRDQPAVYSQEKVDKAMSEGPSAFVTHDIELSEKLSDLQVFPPEQPTYTNTPDAEIFQHLQDNTLQQKVSGIVLYFVMSISQAINIKWHTYQQRIYCKYMLREICSYENQIRLLHSNKLFLYIKLYIFFSCSVNIRYSVCAPSCKNNTYISHSFRLLVKQLNRTVQQQIQITYLQMLLSDMLMRLATSSNRGCTVEQFHSSDRNSSPYTLQCTNCLQASPTTWYCFVCNYGQVCQWWIYAHETYGAWSIPQNWPGTHNGTDFQ